MCDFSASCQIKKLEGPLDIAGGPETNCTNSASLLSVGRAWFLVCLYIGTKCQMTISFVVKLGSSDNGFGTHHPGHPPLGGKALIHFTQVWTILMSISSGIDVKGSECLVA